MDTRVLRAPALITIVLSIWSCGIPTIQFLGAPASDSVQVFPTPPAVSFAHNSADNSDENFLGYEVYYKFYPQNADPQSGDFGTDLAAIDNAPSGSGKSVPESRGFRRMWEPWATDSSIWLPGEVPADIPSPPLLKIDNIAAATDFQIQLSFPDRPSALLADHPARSSKADFDGSTTYLIRNPYAWTILTQRSFDSDALNTGLPDPDLPSNVPDTDSVIHLGLVVLAYGIDFTGGTFQTIYSDPLMIDRPLEIILQ